MAVKSNKEEEKYAIIRLQGHQHKVMVGDELVIDKAEKEDLEPEVLFISDGDKYKVGQPLIKGAKIKLKVLEENMKGPKLHVRKYKAKSRYRKKIGFRPQLTKVKIEAIS